MKYTKKDINHKPFTEALDKKGIRFWDVSQNNIGCDLIVFLKTQNYNTWFVEIKNGFSDSAQKLTDNEAKFKEVCDCSGVPYLVVVDYEDFRKQLK